MLRAGTRFECVQIHDLRLVAVGRGNCFASGFENLIALAKLQQRFDRRLYDIRVIARAEGFREHVANAGGIDGERVSSWTFHVPQSDVIWRCA